jgi:hypothetical protein
MIPEDGDLDGPVDKPWRLMDARYWAAMAFLVLCLVAAAVVAIWGPSIWPRHAPPATQAPAAASPNHLPLRPDPR